jgi:uncharacterized protein YndB with AHSA1/START domain
MSGEPPGPPGDQVRVSVLVAVEPATAFRAFTEEIDRWWRQGPKYRVAGRRPGLLRLEPWVGGRLFESYSIAEGTRVLETGRVTAFDPPSRLGFDWRASNFAPDEKTSVEVLFDLRPSGTLVTVTHRGFASLRPDHPVRHGLATQAFIRSMGLWWGDLVTSLRQHLAGRVDP